MKLTDEFVIFQEENCAYFDSQTKIRFEKIKRSSKFGVILGGICESKIRDPWLADHLNVFLSTASLLVSTLCCSPTLHCELRRVKCIRINYRSEIFQMEFEVQGLCYNHHARRETALLKYILGIRILGHFLLSMPRICLLFTPFPQICRKNLTEGLFKKWIDDKTQGTEKCFQFFVF